MEVSAIKRLLKEMLFWAIFVCTVSGFTTAPIQSSSRNSPKPSAPRGILPHCKRTTILTGEVVQQNFDTTEITITSTIQLKLGLRETACFHVQLLPPHETSTAKAREASGGFTYNGSLLYTIQFSSLEHHHPVRQRYEFGIPELKSHCVCDCPGGDDHCSVGHSYKNCTKGPACYTTYHAHQKAGGCPHGEESEMCCDVSVSPYKNWRFWALNLGPPDTIAIFHYRLYSVKNGEWTVENSNTIQVPMNKGQVFYLGKDKLQLQVSGDKPGRQLRQGMYFMRDNETTFRHGVPINELHEWSFGKLGWFRLQKGVWGVRSGWIKMEDAHHVSVADCKAQKYTDSFNAEYYVSDSALEGETPVTNFHLGYYVESFEPWILSSKIANAKLSRHAVVSHRESSFLTLDMVIDNRPVLKFFHHTSKFLDFHGQIHLDKHSNRYLNVSFLEAHGTLIGSVYHSEQKRRIDIAFSTYIGAVEPSNESSIISLPSSVNDSRWVCFHPAGQPDLQLCRWTKYYAKPLSWFTVPHQWSANQGDCQGCNEITVNNFMQYLNPRQWLNGISGTSEALAMIFEVVLYVIIGLVIIAIIRKCLCPLIKWTVCNDGSKKKKGET